VFVSNVLEHLPSQDAVGAALARIGESLAAGGRTDAVTGPNFRYCARGYFDCADHTLALTLPLSPSTCMRPASTSPR